MNAFARLLIRLRSWFVAGILLACLLAGLGVRRLSFDDNYKDVFRAGDARYQQFDRLATTFGAGDGDCVILLESSDILSREALAAIRQIHNRSAKLPTVESVVSLHSARKPRRIGRLFPPLFPDDNAPDEQLQRARADADKNPLVRGPLLTADHRTSVVLVRLHDPSRPIAEVAPIMSQLRAIIAASTTGTGVTGQLTGMPAIRVETIQRLQREQLLISATGTLLATFVAWALLRRMTAVALVVLPALVGVLLTMGVVGLAGRDLNAINIVLPALVMVIGVSDSIHLMFHFREARLLGLTSREAAIASVQDLGGACALTALTTAVGFLSLMTADDQVIREFGLFGGVGVTLTFLAVIVLLPILCSTGLGDACVLRGSDHAHEVTWPDWLLDRLAPRARWIVAGTVLLSGALSVAAWHIWADYSFLENLTDSSEAYSAMRSLERRFGGAPILQVLVEWPESESVQSPQTLDALSDAHAALNSSGIASSPLSFYTLLQSLPGEGDDLSARYGHLQYVPARMLQSIVNEEHRLALITAYAPDAGAAALREPLDALDAQLRRIEERHSGYRLHLTGFAVLATYRTTPMIMNLLTGLSMELLIIGAVISLVLRSLRLGLLSLPSNLFPLLATAALLVLSGLPLQYATVLAFNICLGIAVDDTVHFLSRYKSELAATGDRCSAVRNSFRAVAPVMVTQTILMITGFGAGMFCSIPTIRAFSACSCAALLLALASELLIAPALLLCFGLTSPQAVQSRAAERIEAETMTTQAEIA